jgi:hypothetical protein
VWWRGVRGEGQVFEVCFYQKVFKVRPFLKAQNLKH